MSSLLGSLVRRLEEGGEIGKVTKMTGFERLDRKRGKVVNRRC